MAHTRIGQIRECPHPRGGGPCLIFGAKWIVCNRDLSSFFGVSEIFNCIFFAENHLDVTLDPWIWILDYVAEEIYNEDIVLLVRGEGKGEVGGGGWRNCFTPLYPLLPPPHTHCRYPASKCKLVGSLSNNDGDQLGKCWQIFLELISKFRKRKGKSSCVHVLHKTWI